MFPHKRGNKGLNEVVGQKETKSLSNRADGRGGGVVWHEQVQDESTEELLCLYSAFKELSLA